MREVLSVREREREKEIQTDRERERERERDGSDVTIVALKLVMNLHFPLPKIRTALSLHFPLPKIRTFRFSLHTSRLSLRREVTMVALKFTMSSHFPMPIFPPSAFVPPLSNGTSRATSDRKPKTNDQILPSPIIGSAEALPILCVRYFRWERQREKLIPKTIGNRKRDCAWGCAGVKKLKKNQLLSTNHQNPYLLRLVMILCSTIDFSSIF